MPRFNLLFPYVLFGVIIVVIVWTNLPTGSADDAAPSEYVCGPCGMAIDVQTALTAEVDGRELFFCSPWCRDRQLSAAQPAAQDGQADVDVVCRMAVNPAWGIQSTHQGRDYHFCTARCQALFERDPDHYIAEKCVVCEQALGEASYVATYLDKRYALCSEAHRRDFKADPASYFMHTMWGIPPWLYYTSIAAVLVVSFGLFDWLGRRTNNRPRPHEHTRRRGRPALSGSGGQLVETFAPVAGAAAMSAAVSLPVISLPTARELSSSASASLKSDRLDLLDSRWIMAAARSRGFRFTLQLILAVLFVVIIAAGLFGNQNPALNIAPLLTWTVWWGMLPILILFAGKAWCYVCPWDAMAGWIEKLRFWEKTDEGLSLNRRWPRIVRNISIATILFVGLTWIELGFGVTMRPRVTAYLAVGMLFLAITAALLFERKSFCRYGCLVGRVSGLYALFGAAEVRSRDKAVCHNCHTKECVRGSEDAYGCPTFLYPGKLQTNTYCIQCMECVQACPHDNLALNLRPWGSDLVEAGRPRADEAYLALLMLSITGFHGLTMTPAWQKLVNGVHDLVSGGHVLGFSLGMIFCMVAPIAIYAVLVAASWQLGRRTALAPLSYRDYFIRYAYALLPIALFYHIAHNLEHLLMEGPKVLALASDPFGWNWDLFGTAGWNVPPLISLTSLWPLQAFLVLVGHVYSLWVAQKTSLRLFGTPQAAFKSQVPMLIGMICFSVFSLWLLKQPMEMRTSAM